MMKRFKCKECGYIHIGEEPPEVCPVCGFDKEVFFELEGETTDDNVRFYDMIEYTDLRIIKNLRHQFDALSQMTVVSLVMSKQALKEGKDEDAKKFKLISEKLMEEASVSAMMLGEFTEFNTETNKSEMMRKLEKEANRNDELLKLLKEERHEEYLDVISGNIEEQKSMKNLLK